MIAIVDVHYTDNEAFPACVTASDWTSGDVISELTSKYTPVAEYQAGRFRRRELAPLLAVLELLEETPSTIVIDGYVWLSEDDAPGLGAHLYRELVEPIPIVGIAKSRYGSGDHAIKVLRGGSKRPLYVTSIGMQASLAASYVQRMHGQNRVPTLLKAVDTLARDTSRKEYRG
jgi:deoxyribonuclease V